MNFINNLLSQTTNAYNVNLFVLELFFILSLPLYYPGYFLMIRAGYKYYKQARDRHKPFNLGDLVKSRGFLLGLIINRFGWVLPYLYLVVVGRNLPLWVCFMIIMWLIATTVLLLFRSKKKILGGDVVYKITNKPEEIKARSFLSSRYSAVGFISEEESKLPYLDEYVKYSKYFIAKKDKQIIGVARVVSYSSVGLPVLNDSKIFSEELKSLDKDGLDRVVEIGNLAAVPGHNIAPGLYKITARYCINNKLVPVARIDKDLLEKLIEKYWFLRFFIKRIGEDVPYPGSVCVPIRIKFYRFMLLFI